jgi:hypothetical protein
MWGITPAIKKTPVIPKVSPIISCLISFIIISFRLIIIFNV